MRIDILTVLPGLLEGPFSGSIMKRAQEKGLAEVHIHNIRDYSTDKHKNVDDYQYGGGAGMVLSAEPIATIINILQKERDYDEVIYLTPDGDVLNQQICNHFSSFKNIIMLCGHYKGVDERIRQKYITREISIGDYVLSGGELAAAVLGDSIIRLLPGVLNDETSALTDSFQDDLLAPPVYTRPTEFEGMVVPPILISGDTAKVEDWRMDQAFEKTRLRRPDLLAKHSINEK